ncbi:26S proteasome non-ATPase regulatory subunit 5-like [Homarus americanus]|uniref:26S proteasome non-ATPase regulatory subunit 5 n=2 Tax=Homarus americanus TaxID=6706 RepID=A0A8J5N844_HOMAM|nr:26S proteasome non-ATPase regulatory subunit 5-like [Homarus americanus]
MQEVMSKSDIYRFNVYEFIVQVCLLGDMSLGVVSNSGLLDRLTGEVTTGDILTQLNALELLTPLVLNPSGMVLLDRGGVIAKLQYLLSLAETDPMTALLMPGLIKFFGNMGHSRPRQMIKENSSVVVMILRLAAGSLDLGDPTLQLVAIQTVAHIGSSPAGKLALAKFKTEMDEVMDVLGSRMRVAPTEQRICVLEALTQLFSVQIEYQTEELTGLLELWWASVGGVNLEKVVAVARQPFMDLHCAALGLLNTLANMPWGQRLICYEPGLIEYILDRTTESEKLGKECKWTVVETLVKSPSTSSIFTENHMSQLEKYFNQGPFYVEAQVEVAVEGLN